MSNVHEMTAVVWSPTAFSSPLAMLNSPKGNPYNNRFLVLHDVLSLIRYTILKNKIYCKQDFTDRQVTMMCVIDRCASLNEQVESLRAKKTDERVNIPSIQEIRTAGLIVLHDALSLIQFLHSKIKYIASRTSQTGMSLKDVRH